MAYDPSDVRTTWTPEKIMKDYNEELKGAMLVRVAEWYKNSELETKINQFRPLGSPIKSPALFGTLRRGYESIALRDGQLPTEWRLAYDKRKVENLSKRFGESEKCVMMLRRAIQIREARKVVVLPATPTLEQLDEARPERGHDQGYAFESHDYWYKIIAASEKHEKAEIAKVFGMGVSMFGDELSKAKRLVARFTELDNMQRSGIAVTQTYVPPSLLGDKPAIFVPVERTSIMKLKVGPSTKLKRDSSSPASHPPVSPTMRRALYHLRDSLVMSPHRLVALADIAASFDTDPTGTGYVKEDCWVTSTCETVETLTAYREFCSSSSMLATYGAERVAKCIAWAVDVWLEHVDGCESQGEAIKLTFLEGLLGVLWNIEEVEAEMEHEQIEQDRWAEVFMDGGEGEGIGLEG